MAKVVDDLNQIWVEKDGEAVKIGFTRDFLQQLDQCWHILPAHNKRFKRKMPLMTVETNDGLVSILSPVDGFLKSFDQKAQNFPDRLKEDDVILHITSKEEVKAKKQAPTLEAQMDMLRAAAVRPVGRPRAEPNPQAFQAWAQNGAAAQDANRWVIHDDVAVDALLRVRPQDGGL